jgi:L-xylulose reductase
MSCNSFKGKTALVTGAGNGIGRTVTLELVKRGCHVYAIDILPNSLVELKSLASDPALLNTLELDVGGEWSSVRAAVENFIGSSQIQFLVNCAAVIFFESLETTKESSLDKIFNTNFKGLVNITQLVVARMKAAGVQGSIVHVSSNASTHSEPIITMYSALKAALDHFTHLLAVELGPLKIRVNSVNPGECTTEFLSRNNPDYHRATAEYLTTVPLRRYVEPNEVADAVLFLLSDATGIITGTNMIIDGGRDCV